MLYTYTHLIRSIQHIIILITILSIIFYYSKIKVIGLTINLFILLLFKTAINYTVLF